MDLPYPDRNHLCSFSEQERSRTTSLQVHTELESRRVSTVLSSERASRSGEETMENITVVIGTDSPPNHLTGTKQREDTVTVRRERLFHSHCKSNTTRERQRHLHYDILFVIKRWLGTFVLQRQTENHCRFYIHKRGRWLYYLKVSVEKSVLSNNRSTKDSNWFYTVPIRTEFFQFQFI